MEKFGVPITDEEDFAVKSAQIRQAICTTPNLGQFFVGAIQAKEAYALKGPDGRLLMEHLRDQGVLPIGKLCGLVKEPGDPAEGLIPASDMANLPEQLQALVDNDIHVTKIRNTVAALLLGRNRTAAAEQMVQIHKMCAANGQIAAVLEPEFLLKNPGTLEENVQLMTEVLGTMWKGIQREGLENHPFILKTSFPTPGSQSKEPIDPEQSAEAMQRILEATQLPPELMIVFLSGGHDAQTARILLQAMAQRQGITQRLGSSFSRAILQSTYQKAFLGEGGFNPDAAQDEILKQGFLNELAMEGAYEPGYENPLIRGEDLMRGLPEE
jgi:fructose-bisphosphate aldolase class 1